MLFVGADILEIERIRKVVGRHPLFFDKILTGAEKEYCLRQADPIRTLAGRFAAKEAILKCAGVGLKGVSWQDMEILPDQDGAPQARFAEGFGRVLQEKGVASIKVSISHGRDYAMAVAVGEGVKQ